MPDENENESIENIVAFPDATIAASDTAIGSGIVAMPDPPAASAEPEPIAGPEPAIVTSAPKAPISRRRVVIGKAGGASVKPAPKAAPTKAGKAAPTKAPQAEPASTSASDERAEARRASALAVAQYYGGKSLPFKAACDLKRKAPINFSLNRDPSARTAGLLAAILTYCNVQPDGTFVRGSGRVPGSMLGYTGPDASRMLASGAESGCLSNCLPDRIAYISGPTGGPGCENAVFRLRFDAVESNLRAYNVEREPGKRVFAATLRLLGLLRKRGAPKPDAASEAAPSA